MNRQKKTKYCKINAASLNYLYEVSAIPVQIRYQYLEKLLKRKHSHSQKNVRLTKIIEHHISHDTITEWNQEAIIKELDISPGSLYYHKSVYLKILREMYFGWEDLKKDFEYKRASAEDTENVKIAAADKMNEIGMRREAKSVYLKLAKKLEKNKISGENYVVLWKIYDNILEYYYAQSNSKQYHYYIRKCEILYLRRSYFNQKIKPSQSCLIDIIYYSAEAKRHFLHITKNDEAFATINNLEIALDKARKISHYDYMLLMLHRIGVVYQSLNDLGSSYKFFDEGYRMAIEHKKKIEVHSFRAYMTYINLIRNPGKGVKYLAVLKHSFENVTYLKSKSRWVLSVFIIYIHLLNYFRDEEYENVQDEYIRHLTLFPKTKMAEWYRYTKLMDINKMYSWEKLYNDQQGSYTLTVTGVDPNAVKKMETLTDSIYNRSRRFSSVDFNIQVYTNKLWTEFIKGIKDNYGAAELFINKIKWTLSTRDSSFFSASFFNIVELGINLFKHKGDDGSIYKFINKFKEIKSQRLLKESNDILGDYALMSFIAKQMDVKEITKHADDIYHYIEENHPEIIKPLIKKVEVQEKTAAA